MKDLLLLIKELFVLLTILSLLVFFSGCVVYLFNPETGSDMITAGWQSSASSAMIALFSAAWAEAYGKNTEKGEENEG